MSKKSVTYLLFLVISIIAVIIFGVIFYNNLLQSEKDKAYENLSGYAQLKIDQIYDWRKERISDGLFIKNNSVIIKQVFDFIQNPNDTSLKKKVIEWIRDLKENHEYHDIVIIKTDYTPYTLFSDHYNINPRDSIFLRESLKENKVTLAGLYKDPISSELYLGTYVPLTLPGNNEVFAFIKVIIDPKINLYPLIESVPTSSKTSETFLVRQDGDSVTFLNDLKFRKNAALSYKLPLSLNTLPAVMAVKGKVGIFEGIDYTGKRVLSDLNRIPDSRWFIVSKINLSEIYEPVRNLTVYIFLGVLTIIILFILVAYTFWRNQVLKNLEEQLQYEKEMRDAEQALKSSEERFATAFSVHPNALIISRIDDGKILEVNGKFLELFHLTRDEVIGNTTILLNLYSNPEDRAKLISTLKQIGTIRDFEVIAKIKTGEERILSLSAETFKTTKEQTFLTIIQDITEKKQTEIALIESEKRFRKMFEDHKAVMLLIDPESGKIIDANPSALDFYGFSYEELCSMRIQDINQLSPDEVSNKMKKSKGKFQNYHIFPHKLANGNVRIVEVYSSPLTMEKRPLLFSIIHDITERKQIESRLHDALLNLQEKEVNLSEAQKLAKLGSFTIDLERERPILSVELYNIFEIEPFKELTVSELFSYVHTSDVDSVRAAVKNAIEKKQDTMGMEFRIITPKGNLKYLDYIGKFFFDQEGKLIRRFGIIMDITERKITQLKMQELLNNLTRSNKDLEAFAYSASHDLHEPIRMIKSYAQLINLKEKEGLNDATIEYLKFIEEGASRMQHLINDLLIYSRLSTTHQDFEEVDCNLVIKDVLNDLRFKIEEEQARINSAHLPKVRGNHSQLRQLFQNFIQNALKFRSEKNPEIEVLCERRNDVWLFSIRDNGIGIDETYYERIFVIFQRLHAREKYPGTGIGLAMCKKIVERHGGQVCVESVPGTGSIFYFTLPI